MKPKKTNHRPMSIEEFNKVFEEGSTYRMWSLNVLKKGGQRFGHLNELRNRDVIYHPSRERITDTVLSESRKVPLEDYLRDELAKIGSTFTIDYNNKKYPINAMQDLDADIEEVNIPMVQEGVDYNDYHEIEDDYANKAGLAVINPDGSVNQKHIKVLNIGERNHIHRIGARAFEGVLIDELNINNVDEIADEAFAYCHIQTLNLGPKVYRIGERAFYENDLEAVVLPSSLAEIGSEAFGENPLNHCPTIIVPPQVKLLDRVFSVSNETFATIRAKEKWPGWITLVIKDNVTVVHGKGNHRQITILYGDAAYNEFGWMKCRPYIFDRDRATEMYDMIWMPNGTMISPKLFKRKGDVVITDLEEFKKHYGIVEEVEIEVNDMEEGAMTEVAVDRGMEEEEADVDENDDVEEQRTEMIEE